MWPDAGKWKQEPRGEKNEAENSRPKWRHILGRRAFVATAAVFTPFGRPKFLRLLVSHKNQPNKFWSHSVTLPAPVRMKRVTPTHFHSLRFSIGQMSV